jgi:tRNA pseudouridine32 synthase / 23S rRNA pseudouridine746 synthase
MIDNYLFQFNHDLNGIEKPTELNNPFGTTIPRVAQIAAREFQEFIASEISNWEHNFDSDKGKMFGVLVVQKANKELAFLGTISGKLSGDKQCEKFTPSVFQDSTDDWYINKGMKELTQIGNQIELASHSQKAKLKEIRRQKSHDLQNWLFENYKFSNLSGLEANVIEIFGNSEQGNPPAAAGECAAPKLLAFALANQLKPIAIAEFWWGNTPKSEERIHKAYYPACKNKCRPILEYMLEDNTLFNVSKFS